MARKKAKALPHKMITVYAEILQETEDGILVRCDKEADGVWLPKSQIKYEGDRGDTGVEIQIPEWLADEKGFVDGMGFKQEEPPIFPESGQAPDADPVQEATPEPVKECATCKHSDGSGGMTDCEACNECGATDESDDEFPRWEASADTEADDTTTNKRIFGDNVKWIKEESITVTQPLTEAERARYADEMAALDEQIEDLEDERAEVSSRLKKQIDAKEEERRGMSRIVNSGEARTIRCDCLKDYNTGEMVWTNAYPPYEEVQRRKMTPEEKQPGLLEYPEKNIPPAVQDSGTEPQAAAPADDAAGQKESRCPQCKWNGSEHCADCFDEEMFDAAEEQDRTCGTCRHLHENDSGALCMNPNCNGVESGADGWEPISLPPAAAEQPATQEAM